MDIDKMLEQLHAERDAIDQAIITLERLEVGHAKRRGRPPAWLAEARRREPAGAGPEPPRDAKKRNKPPASRNTGPDSA